MLQGKEFSRQLKVAAKTGKFVVGRREVSESVKGSKLLVWSSSANVPQSILDQSRTLSVPALRFDGNPVELGRTCGIPFRVSVIAVKSAGDADLSEFSNASDYLSSWTAEPERQSVVKEDSKKERLTEEKSARKTRKKQEKSIDVEKESAEEAVAETKKPKKRTRKIKAKSETEE